MNLKLCSVCSTNDPIVAKVGGFLSQGAESEAVGCYGERSATPVEDSATSGDLESFGFRNDRVD